MQGIPGIRSCARGFVAAWLLATVAGAPVAAQTDPALQAEIQSVFQELFRDPGNAELTYRYAQLQIRAGNYEGAVAALERLLLVAPNQPRLQYEIGILYFRMGSFEAARSYLMQAQASPDTPPEIKQRIAAFLTESDRRTARHQFFGSVTAGMRYQTNANLSTGASTVQASGVVINTPETPRADWSGLVLGRLTHIYDFRTNDQTVWLSNVHFYGNWQIDVTTANLSLGELHTGPRFQFFPRSRPGATIRPYFITNAVGLDGSFYSSTFGGGLDLSVPFGSRWAVEVSYQFRAIDYDDISSQPTASVLTGNENLIRARAVYQTTPSSALLGEVSGRFVGTRSASFDFNEFGVVATFTQDYRPFGSLPWNVTASAGYYYRNYAAPDPVVNPTVARRENEVRLSLANVIPLAERWFLVQQIDGLIIDGNLPNYDRRNLSVTAAVRWRF